MSKAIKMPYNLIIKLQKLVLSTNHIPFFNWFYKLFYIFSINAFISKIKRFICIKKIFLRRGLTTKTWVPGSSDIDLFLLIDNNNLENDITFLKQFWKIYHKLKRIFPFFGEIQIANTLEFSNYCRFGNIRSYEMKNWASIYTRKTDNPSIDQNQFGYEYQPLKYKLDLLTEMLSAYFLLINTYFSNWTHTTPRNAFKAFIDILRYGSYQTNDLQKPHEDRDTFIDHIHNNSNDPELADILRNMDNTKGFVKFDSNIFTQTISYAVRYLDTLCAQLNKNFKNISSDTKFREISNNYRFQDSHFVMLKEESQKLFKQLSMDGKMQIVNIIIPAFDYLPSYMYIVLNQTDNINNIISNLRYQILSENKVYNPFIVTESILNCLSYSLFCENPFNYYSLKNEWISSHDYNINKPDDSILSILIKECITNISISLRMYEHKLPNLSNIYIIHFILDRILRLRLAQYKETIVAAPMSKLIEIYHNYYPNAEKWPMEFAKYFTATNKTLPLVDVNKVFYHNYPFIRNTIGELNEDISK